MATVPMTCGLDAVLVLIGAKWKPLILYHLAYGTLRYGELRRLIPAISNKMLIQQLKELHADGAIERFDYQEIPPKVEYSLSPFGRSLANALAPLCAWGTEHMQEVETMMTRRRTAKENAAPET